MADIFVCSGTVGGTRDGTTWDKAWAKLTDRGTILNTDTIYVHKTHNATYAASTTITLPASQGARILCVDGGDATFSNPVAMGTTVGTLTTGAKESAGAGNFNMVVAGYGYLHGMQLQANDGGSRTGFLGIGYSSLERVQKWVDCTFSTNSTAGSAVVRLCYGGSTNGSNIELVNPTFIFGNASQKAELYGPVSIFGGVTSGTAPTTLFTIGVANNLGLRLFSSGGDWSAATNCFSPAGDDSPGIIQFVGCKIATPVTGSFSGGPQGLTVEFVGCGTGADANYTLNYFKTDGSGTVEDDTSVYKTTGGAQGTDEGGTATSYSLKMVGNSTYATHLTPCYSPWIYRKIDSTGSKTLTIEIATTAAALKDTEAWAEFEYMGTSGVPQFSLGYDGDVPVTSTGTFDVTDAGTNRTDLANDGWTGITTEYEYALAKTITINVEGYVRARVGLAKNQTIYVDPKIAVT